MRYREVKLGAKVYFVDEPEKIGEITEIDSEHYFIITYHDEPKSILMNPYQAGYDELSHLKLVNQP